jgi:hypothetical protein
VYIVYIRTYKAVIYLKRRGRDSAGTIGTRYGQDPIPVKSRFFAPVQTGPGAHPMVAGSVIHAVRATGG